MLDGTAVYSCYYSLNASLEIFQADLDDLEGSIRQWPGPITEAGDFNAKSRSWSGGPENRRRQLLDEMMVSLDLIVINQPGMATFERRASTSVLDLTFLRPTLRKHQREWTILEEESLSNHRYVSFVFKSRKRDAPRAKPTGWAVKKFDRDAFAECISGTSELDKTRTMDELTRNYTTEISQACDAFMPRRRQHKNQRPAFWWNTEISELRNSCKKQGRLAQRMRKSKYPEQEEKEDKYKDARKLLRNAIKQSKRQCWKALCTDVDQDPWGTPHRLMIRKLQASRGTVASTDVPTVFKIVGYPSDVAPEVPLFQMSELKLAVKRLVSGKAPGPDGIPNEVLSAIIRKKPQLILDLLNTCLERAHLPKQ